MTDQEERLKAVIERWGKIFVKVMSFLIVEKKFQKDVVVLWISQMGEDEKDPIVKNMLAAFSELINKTPEDKLLTLPEVSNVIDLMKYLNKDK